MHRNGPLTTFGRVDTRIDCAISFFPSCFTHPTSIAYLDYPPLRELRFSLLKSWGEKETMIACASLASRTWGTIAKGSFALFLPNTCLLIHSMSCYNLSPHLSSLYTVVLSS